MINRFLLILFFSILTNNLFGQASDSLICKNDYIFGAWYDSTKVSTGGTGFIFTPDGCCSIIMDGDITSCEKGNTKILFQVDYSTIPRQIHIKFINIKTDSLKKTIPMIFNIIDLNHIRLGIHKDLKNNRPLNFDDNNDLEISIMTRFIEKGNNN